MEPPTSPLWPSWRLVYTICAFFAMVVQLCMNNALNFGILCMIKPGELQSQNFTAAPKQLQSDPGRKCSFQLEDDSLTAKEYQDGEFEWSKHQEWILVSSYFYGYMVVLPVAGRLADKFGGKYFLVAGLLGQACMFMLIPIMARVHFWLAVTTRVIQGFLAGFTVPSMYQLYTVWAHPTERAALISFAYGGYAVGSISVFPITSSLCQTGWTSVFYVIGGGAFVVGLICTKLIYNTLEAHPWLSEREFAYLKGGRDQTKKVPAIPWRQIFTSCPIWAFIVTHICHSSGLIALNISLPRYLRDTMHFSLKENGYYSSALHVGSITSRLIVMICLKKLHELSKQSLTVFRRIVYSCGNIVTVLSFIAITVLTCENRMVIVLLILVIGASIDVSFTGAYWVSCIDMAPAFAGLIAGIANSGATLSGILVPLALSSVLSEGTKHEWNYLFYSMAVSYALSMMVYSCFGSSEKQKWGDFVSKPDKKDAEQVKRNSVVVISCSNLDYTRK